MWEPYLKVIREKCSEAIHILDRFHIVSKMNKALDEIRAGESRRIASEAKVGVSSLLRLSVIQHPISSILKSLGLPSLFEDYQRAPAVGAAGARPKKLCAQTCLIAA
jgi:hypothetical protein